MKIERVNEKKDNINRNGSEEENVDNDEEKERRKETGPEVDERMDGLADGVESRLPPTVWLGLILVGQGFFLRGTQK